MRALLNLAGIYVGIFWVAAWLGAGAEEVHHVGGSFLIALVMVMYCFPGILFAVYNYYRFWQKVGRK